jgi:hypothetical protein
MSAKVVSSVQPVSSMQALKARASEASSYSSQWGPIEAVRRRAISMIRRSNSQSGRSQAGELPSGAGSRLSPPARKRVVLADAHGHLGDLDLLGLEALDAHPVGVVEVEDMRAIWLSVLLTLAT